MKVYLTSIGEYADYYVAGIFTSKKLAEQSMLVGGRKQYNDIEEMELDDPALLTIGESYELGLWYMAQVDLETGEIKLYPDRFYGEIYRHPTKCRIEYFPTRDGMGWNGPYHVQARVVVYSPISFAHAEKVAVEKRQEWLTTGNVEV